MSDGPDKSYLFCMAKASKVHNILARGVSVNRTGQKAPAGYRIVDQHVSNSTKWFEPVLAGFEAVYLGQPVSG